MSTCGFIVAYCCVIYGYCLFFFFKQKTAYEMRISDWSSDVCSSDLLFASLLAFAEGRRHSGFMRAAAAGLDEAAMRQIAEHYGAATPEEDARASRLEGNKTGGDAAAGGVIADRKSTRLNSSH